MVIVEIGQGESVAIRLRDSDGEFIVAYGDDEVTVTADLPDADGNEGVIYRERFGADDEYSVD